MRIRKNRNLFAAIRKESGIENLTAYMCQLNQSPWDAMSFSDEEFQNDYDSNENESLHGSVNAIKSVTLGDGKEMVAEKMRSKDNDIEIIEDNSEITNNLCKKKRFSNEKEDARIGGELKSQQVRDCKNHVPKDRRNHEDPSNIREPAESTIISEANSSKGRPKRKSYSQRASSSANNDGFYYYCWFGPRWGKRRGNRMEENKSPEQKDTDGAAGASRNAIPSSDPACD